MQTRLKLLALSIIVLSMAVGQLNAKLVVIADIGGESAQPYYDELGLSSLSVDEAIDSQHITISTPVTVSQMLPVISTKLTPDQVTTRHIKAQGLTPFFIIGSDALSKQWLLARKDELINLGAKGLVVNVQTSDELEALQALVPELLLQPTYGDDIAERLNLAHYPVLITSEIITQ